MFNLSFILITLGSVVLSSFYCAVLLALHLPAIVVPMCC